MAGCGVDEARAKRRSFAEKQIVGILKIAKASPAIFAIVMFCPNRGRLDLTRE